jgi:SAM-dependent methyltransferase
LIYRDFARLYASGDYPEFSAHIAQLLPSLLKQYHLHPNHILDLACGEGTFAVAMVKQGFKVTGVDQSPDMLILARKKAHAEHLTIPFIEMDIRRLKLNTTFDLITCWFDSLNYLLTYEDLEATFSNIIQHLNPGGFFIFDMNTTHWLATLAERHAVTIERETNDIFQVHRHSYDKDTHIATFHFIGFIKENDCWIRRVDETHYERGYTLEEIHSCLDKAGLSQVACFGSLDERLPPSSDSKRVWFITKK